jgi:hypothetical protein
MEVQTQEAHNPRILERQTATQAVGAEVTLFQQKLGDFEASTGVIDEEARRVIELVPDVLKQAESFAVDSGNPHMTLSEALAGRSAQLEASGALDPSTKSNPHTAESIRLYARAIDFAAVTTSRVEGEYGQYYNEAAKAHPANSRQTHATAAQARLFAKYYELGQNTEGTPVEAAPSAATATAESTASTAPATRGERLDSLLAQERTRLLSDPGSIDEALSISRGSVSRLATAARKKHEANPTAESERTLRQYKEHQQDFTYLNEQVRHWQARRAEGGPTDLGTYMAEARAAQDAELERYAEAGGKVPQDVDQRMDHFDRAYRAFAGSSNYTTLSDGVNRIAMEHAQNQAG